MSTDGQVLWWDTRRLGQPLEDLTLREKAPAAGVGDVVAGLGSIVVSDAKCIARHRSPCAGSAGVCSSQDK